MRARLAGRAGHAGPEHPTIGIGAGPACDAQVLSGRTWRAWSRRTANFVPKDADVAMLREAATAFADDVTGGVFPDAEHSDR